MHTPAPWSIEVIGSNARGDVFVVKDSKRWTLTEPMAGPEELANARLIAASPDMLAALELVAEHIDQNAPNPSRSRPETLAAVRAAIQKAKGQ